MKELKTIDNFRKLHLMSFLGYGSPKTQSQFSWNLKTIELQEYYHRVMRKEYDALEKEMLIGKIKMLQKRVLLSSDKDNYDRGLDCKILLDELNVSDKE